MLYFENKKIKTYYTLNNGKQYYKIILQPILNSSNKTFVQIFIQKRFSSKNLFKDKPLITLITSEILLGESLPNRERTFWEESYGSDYNGNSLLINIHDLQYIFIGDVIYTFILKSKLITYESPIGLSLISYPWIKDEEGYIYLLAYEKIMKSNTYIDYLINMKRKDPYMILV